MQKKLFAVTLALLSLTVVAPGAADEPVPFPTHRSQILRKEGTVYTITGRQTIPAGVEVSCQKDIRIRGIGSAATLVVIGSLQAHGVSMREIIFENITIEPGEECEDLHLDMCTIRGGGVRTAKDRPVKGKLFIEGVSFTDGATLDVTMSSGHLDLSSVSSGRPVHLNFVEEEGVKRNSCKVKVRGSSFDGGLFIENGADVTVRLNSMGGAQSKFTDNDILTFDGNKVTSETLEFVQTRSGKFGKTKLQKCDIYSSKLVARSPKKADKSEKVYVDKCWFRGKAREKELRTGLIVDGKDDPDNAAQFRFKKINERALELAGSLER